MGTVIPAREIEIRPRVSGQIMRVSDEFVPGGMFYTGDVLLEIDSSDFELIVQSRLSDVATARSNLELEMGQQSVSRKEFELLGEDIEEGDSDLILRKPQLDAAEANLNRAEASLNQAKLNLERTRVRAPFNAMVKSRNIDLGVQVTPNNPLAVITNTDKYWVRVVVPVEELQWLQIPRPGSGLTGSSARIFNENGWGKTVWREGRIIRLMNSLETQGRMAQLLVEIDDPLSLNAENSELPPLILDSYLRVEIEGKEINNVIALNRDLIRNGNQVWIMDEQNKLEIRDVNIIYLTANTAIISQGLKRGERIISTKLSAPVIGMDLQVYSSRKNNVSKQSTTQL
jgi:RND family efflux transporter MFP subunit